MQNKRIINNEVADVFLRKAIKNAGKHQIYSTEYARTLNMKYFFFACGLLPFLMISCATQREMSLAAGSVPTSPLPRFFYPETAITQRDSLMALYGNNKRFVPEFELPALLALSCYPDLREVAINFSMKNIHTSLATRPRAHTVFRQQRHYTIFIDNDSEYTTPLLHDAPFNAQVGIIGHELAHIADYEQKTGWQIIGTGLRYLHHPSRPAFERGIDLLALQRGLCHQLYDWALFIEASEASPEYKAYKRKTYMTVEEVKKWVDE